MWLGLLVAEKEEDAEGNRVLEGKGEGKREGGREVAPLQGSHLSDARHTANTGHPLIIGGAATVTRLIMLPSPCKETIPREATQHHCYTFDHNPEPFLTFLTTFENVLASNLYGPHNVFNTFQGSFSPPIRAYFSNQSFASSTLPLSTSLNPVISSSRKDPDPQATPAPSTINQPSNFTFFSSILVPLATIFLSL